MKPKRRIKRAPKTKTVMSAPTQILVTEFLDGMTTLVKTLKSKGR